MSASTLFSIGARAMAANQAVLNTISNNIANASTPGYSRQQTVLATAIGQQTGSGFFGKGVDVQTVIRNHDEYLTSEAQRSSSLAASDASRLAQLKQLENAFDTGDSGIGQAAGALLNAFVDVANQPQDSSARQVALARAEELASRFRDSMGQIDALQTGVSQDVATSVAAVNSLAKQMAAVNRQIALANASGHTPNDLLDKRDQLITDIGKYVQVSAVPSENGQMSLFVGNGQQLVLGQTATTLKVMEDPYDPKKVQIGVTEGSYDRAIPSDSMVGGSIAGLLRFQNHDLNDARDLLGQMATAIAGKVNEQQALGVDLKNPAGPGAPMFSIGEPQVLPASSNAKTGSTFNSSVNVQITSPTEVMASEYELRADPATPGNYIVKRMGDGLERSIASGAEIDGMTITVPAPAPGPGDRFLLRPVGNAARSIENVLKDPSGIAAASPITATVPATNTGTATVASLMPTDPSLNPNLQVTLNFTDDAGGYSYSVLDTTTGLPAGTGSGTWTPDEPIAINGFELNLAGVPRGGDSVVVSKTSATRANNGNALAMVDLRDKAMVGLSGGIGGDTITDAYAKALADVGVRVQTAASTAAISKSVAADAEASRSSQSGVNLDEEAAQLIQFQQSYQAAAKVLQVAQSIFDSLLQATSG